MRKEIRRTFSRQSCLELEDDLEETLDTPPSERKMAFLDIFTVQGNKEGTESGGPTSPAGGEPEAEGEVPKDELEKSNGGFEGGFPVEKPPDPPTFFALCIVSTICLNPVFGGIGIYLSAKARRALRKGKQERAKRLGQAALAVCLAGICLTLSIIIISLVIIRPTASGT